MKKRIAVFASGGGTDLQSVIDAVRQGEIEAEIAVVIGSKAGIYALERARLAGIETAVFDKRDFENLDAMYEALIVFLQKRGVDLIVLAGYLTILTPNIVRAFERKIINIHPSLIPKYCGIGFYGMRVHEAVIAGGETESGCTVHYVDEGADTGAIIAQTKVPVYPDDTPETLQKRVLEAEHRLLPQTVKRICKGELQ
ncbi:MAG TPA: phosphoribosylglycinamide formyltransferase [Candidatus Stercoripulliclostridium merdipullorum]|uniref:Phosphoribosylglycinamide formyltransferase n=1 Tax=Candidatus Stercoripulliclostridium merdipullorum TaxID=2840952 RepID=A0A9D1NC15_9FIRM|nr:phosphoribosylglycinamide formyltransferase [Candidatus Stercoripulliclostridium merdipullorum]